MVSQRLLAVLAVLHVQLANAAPCSSATPSWVTVHPVATSTSDDRAARDYWTPKRIADIDSEELIKNAPPIPENVQHLGREFPSKGAIISTVGRLLYTTNTAENTTEDSSCTATLVDSVNGATIITAAHCFHAGTQNPFIHGYHDNFLFIPGYRDGARPFGAFTLNRIVLPREWVERATYEDRAFAVLNLGEDGRVAGEALGEGQQMRFSPKEEVSQRWALGYTRYHSGVDGVPQQGTPAFVGDRLASCNGTALDWRFGNGLTGLECRMSGGASGGPHFEDLDLETGRGTVIAVNNIVDGLGEENLPGMFGVNVTDSRTEMLHKVAESIIITA